MSNSLENIVIVSAQRSAIGSFGKTLAPVSMRDLGSQVLKGMFEKSGINPKDIDKVIVGNVLAAGHGQNIARQIALNSGIDESAPALVVNQVCGSGLQSIIMATQSLQLGECNVVVAGGVENMSQAAYVLPQERWGARMGHSTVIDTMISDGLWDVFGDYHMGKTAENVAEHWKVSRNEQDEFALLSQQKATRAQVAGEFKEEIIPVHIPARKGQEIIFENDEYIRTDASIESLEKLKPAFTKDENGTVTAGNASGINDGAAFTILTTQSIAQKKNYPILGKVTGYNSVGLDPAIMGMGPSVSIKAMAKKYNIDLKEVDRFEINEAFAAQALAVLKDLSLDKDKVNCKGGAIALGHPIGASGTRILCTLLHSMKAYDEKRGVASLCVGGGMGVSVYLER